mgnify:FL=1
MQTAMDFRVKKQALISSNLANRETPSYKAKDVVFEKELSKAYHSDQPAKLKTNHAAHFDGRDTINLRSVKGKVINSHNPSPRQDGNTVNIDKENVKMVENTIMYNALTRMTSHEFGLLKIAVTEGM